MDVTLSFSQATLTMAGTLFLALVTVESGGLYLVKVVTGRAGTTPFQEKFARAGHAHAGVLLVLALVSQAFVDAAGLEGVLNWVARTGVAFAALFMSGGFFFASMGQGRETPNRWIALVYAGGALLAVSLVALGVGLIAA